MDVVNELQAIIAFRLQEEIVGIVRPGSINSIHINKLIITLENIIIS